MALTTLEETQLRELLLNFEGLNDVGNDAAALLASLLAGDVTVLDLPDAAALANGDTIYIAQSGADVKTTVQQLAAFLIPLMPVAQGDDFIYFMGQN